MTKNAYIHIPFCKSKCHYCSFVSFDSMELKRAYLDALKKQIVEEYKREELNTLYFGGGTPSLLTVDEFAELISLFKLGDDAEITAEVNPDSVDLEYLTGLRNLGVNRLSIGAQTFDDDILKSIGRRHNSAQIKTAVNCAQKSDFENISLDFIYGLPNQTLKDFANDLEQAVKLGIQHISLYGLKIDEGCYFYKNQPENIADSDIQADMYLKAIEVLTQNGFEHYEISNFSKNGLESKHNLNYWEGNTYYGFGCAASGYENTPSPLTPLPSRARGNAQRLKHFRYTNESDLKKYIKNPLKKEFEQEISEQERLEESIFLGLRKIAGINIEEINQKFNIDFTQKYAKILEKYKDFFTATQNGIALNQKGILVSNNILSEFID